MNHRKNKCLVKFRKRVNKEYCTKINTINYANLMKIKGNIEIN